MTSLRDAISEPRRTTHEYVRDTLRQAILGGTLRGGTRLVQANLAEDLGVSTTPVREALRDLATEGLLQMDPHRGAIVKKLSYPEIREIQDLSQLLEPEAMRQVGPIITDRALAEATSLAQQMESETDMGRWADLNRRFHGALVSDLDGTRLARILKGLRDSAAPYIGLALQAPESQLGDANRDHQLLLSVLADRDGERAAEITVNHAALTIKVLERSRALFE